MVLVYVDPGAGGTAPRWSRAFAEGCRGRLHPGGPFVPGQAFAFWGAPALWSDFIAARSTCPTWFYGDHGFFGRGTFYRCARNATQFDGSAGDDNPRRFRRFNIPVQDWRTAGGHILLCPNSETFFGLHGFRPGQWVEETVSALRAHTDRPIRVRWKPRSDDRRLRPLADDLKDCWAVVTFVSNSAVMAALAGVPVFCTAPCAGLTVGSGDLSRIEVPVTPDGRDRWAARLANRQWTLDEMSAGALWNEIGG